MRSVSVWRRSGAVSMLHPEFVFTEEICRDCRHEIRVCVTVSLSV